MGPLNEYAFLIEMLKMLCRFFALYPRKPQDLDRIELFRYRYLFRNFKILLIT